MKYNFRNTMLRAWENYRKSNGGISFGEALRRAWFSARAETVNRKGIEAAKATATPDSCYTGGQKD